MSTTSAAPSDIKIIRNCIYASVGGAALGLDIYRPAGTHEVPVALYLHGGAWRTGTRRERAPQRAAALARRGIAVASASYRLVDQATFPAQLHDAKAAVRWLRANGRGLGLAVDRIGAWGASAGGHLAALLGVTAGDAGSSGDVGEHRDVSDAVDGVVCWFAPLDLRRLVSRTPLEAAVLGPAPETALLGAAAAQPEAVRRASPVARVTEAAPPFLLMHGDRDRLLPMEQSGAMHEALTAHGVRSTLVTVGGAGHEDELFESLTAIEMVHHFLADALATG